MSFLENRDGPDSGTETNVSSRWENDPGQIIRSASIKFKIFKCSQSLIFSTLSSFWHLETPLGNNIWTNRTFDQRIIVIYREFWHQNLCNICHIWHFTSIYSIKYYCIRNLETQNCPVSSLYYQRKVQKSGHRILIRVNQFL